MQMGDYYASISHGKEFINNYKGQNYVKSAYFRLFLCYWFLDDSRAWDYFAKAKSEGETLVVPDEYAQKFLEEKLPNKTITRPDSIPMEANWKKRWKLLRQVECRRTCK